MGNFPLCTITIIQRAELVFLPEPFWISTHKVIRVWVVQFIYKQLLGDTMNAVYINKIFWIEIRKHQFERHPFRLSNDVEIFSLIWRNVCSAHTFSNSIVIEIEVSINFTEQTICSKWYQVHLCLAGYWIGWMLRKK